MLAAYLIVFDDPDMAYVLQEVYKGRDLGEGAKGLIVSEAAAEVKALAGNLAIHDFRFARTAKQTKVLFDVVIPFESKVTVEQVEQAAADELASDGKNYSFNINVDRPSACFLRCTPVQSFAKRAAL